MKRFLLFAALGSLLAITGWSQEAGVLRLDTSEATFDQEAAQLNIADWNSDNFTVGEADGHWSASLRVSSPGARGMQFLIDGLHLPAGARLRLLEAGQAGEWNEVATYQGSGPIDGPFWTDAVAGEDVILEAQYDSDEVSQDPFRIVSARVLTESGLAALKRPRSQEPGINEGHIGLAVFRGKVVEYQIRNGVAVTEGDIQLAGADEVVEATDEEIEEVSRGRERAGVGVTPSMTSYFWPGGLVPYTIDPALPNQARVTDAVAHWNNNLGGKITLVPRTNQTYYVRFTYTSNAGTCSSYVGNNNMAGQPVTLGDYCSTGNAIHEIGHTIGLFHEHTRNDRNSYIVVNTANITAGMESNFTQYPQYEVDLGAYDYGSIMHYPSYAFSSNGLPTIVTIPAGIPIGQRDGLSAGDIAAAKSMYSGSTTVTPPPPTTPPPPSTVQVTVASNPTGVTLVVDGVDVVANKVFSWTPGSVHTLSAPSTTTTSTRTLFSSWSDGKAQTHSITVPTSATTYTARYVNQVKITGRSSNSTLGSVTVSPYSADSFYNLGTSLSVGATSQPSACLTSWSGITAPASAPVQVSANKSYDIVGNFQTGAVSISPLSATIDRRGGSGTINVTASTGCTFNATSTVSWISITSRSATTVKFSVNGNNGNGQTRTGYIRIGTATFTVTQNGR